MLAITKTDASTTNISMIMLHHLRNEYGTKTVTSSGKNNSKSCISRTQFLSIRVGYLDIRIHVLHVVIILERFDEVHQRR